MDQNSPGWTSKSSMTRNRSVMTRCMMRFSRGLPASLVRPLIFVSSSFTSCLYNSDSLIFISSVISICVLLAKIPACDGQGDAGDVRGLVGGQEQDRCGLFS